MKKLIALLLVVVMLGSTTAFAADSNASIGVSSNISKTTESTTKDQAHTDLYLQVDAAGQIDVTVPLVLVFKTNIDGGNAATSTNYNLTSASSADLVVTNVAVNVNPETTGNLTANSNPMQLVYYASDLADDTYGVKITVAEQTDAAGQTRAKFEKDVKTDIVPTGITGSVDKTPKEGGLFLVKKDASTPVIVDMITGDLSFVTTRNDDDTAPNADYGVKLLTITYTVAIDTSDPIGTAHGGGTITFPN